MLIVKKDVLHFLLFRVSCVFFSKNNVWIMYEWRIISIDFYGGMILHFNQINFNYFKIPVIILWLKHAEYAHKDKVCVSRIFPWNKLKNKQDD